MQLGKMIWVIPSYEYIYAENEEDVFPEMLEYLSENGMELAGAVHDFTCPKTRKSYMYFPINKI